MAEEKDKGTIFDEPKEDPKEVGVKDGFLPPEEHEESSEKFKEEMDSNERDEEVYTKEGLKARVTKASAHIAENL